MKTTGIIRPVDRMGRIVIPKEIRKQLDVKSEIDSFEIFMEGDLIILKKYQPTCVFCDKLAESVDYAGRTVCYSCIEKLSAIKEQSEQFEASGNSPASTYQSQDVSPDFSIEKLISNHEKE